MNQTGAIWRKLKLAATAAVTWTLTQGVLWAQEGEAATVNTGKARDWALPYFLVLFCVALGVFSVCRTARRRDRAKPEKYGQ